MRRMGLWGLILWLGLTLACNAPFSETTLPEPPTPAGTDDDQSPTNTATTPVDDEDTSAPTGTPVPTEEATSTSAATAAPENTNTPLPTFTPIQQPTLASSPTASATSTPRPTSSTGSNPTATSGSSGPLAVSYNVSWMLDPTDPFKAIASVTLTVSGGNGVYTYYHDEQPVSGPTFTYDWGACRGNPGSFRVDSGDGQSVKIDYFENPPCPTPTPSS